MKTAHDPRHLKRIKIMQSLFSFNFLPQKPSGKIKEIVLHLKKIDKLIQASAPGRPISEINRIDLSILRLAIFELIIVKGEPPKVIIDEAVELGKEFGSESSASFVNGVLGKVITLEGIETKRKNKD